MATVSVIVPVYKVEKYLDRCVSSLLNQSFSEFDLILVDDGSPDTCGEVCEGYATRDPRVRALHRKNGGLSAARNTGIDFALKNCAPQWLAFVDSDDWVAPDYLARLYAAVVETGCKMAVCGLRRTAGEPLPQTRTGRVSVLSADDYYCGEHHGGITATAWNKLYHVSLLESLRYPEGKLHEDEFTTYRAVYAAGTVAVQEDALYAYFQNDAGIMRAPWDPRRIAMLEAFREQHAFAGSIGSQRLARRVSQKYVYAAYEQLTCVLGADKYRSWRAPLRKHLRRALGWSRRWQAFSGADIDWAWEAAYPCKIYWWLRSRMKGRGDP